MGRVGGKAREAGPETGRSPALQKSDGRTFLSFCRLSLSFVFVSPRVPGAERVAESLSPESFSSWPSSLSSCRLGPRLRLGVPVILVLVFVLEFLSFWSCARGVASSLSREARTGDAAAPVVWWTCASERGVPERVRRPRERSGPGATTLTVVGEGLTGHQGKSLLFFRVFVCMLWRRVRQARTA